MPSTKLLRQFIPAKRLEVIFKVGRGYRAYKGTHNGKTKIITFDDGDSLNYSNIKKNTGKKTFINIKKVSYNHVLVVKKDLYPVRILDDELLSTNKATLPISNNEAARILLNMKSNKMNNNEEVIKAARTLSRMFKSRRARSRSGSKSRSRSGSNGGGLKSKKRKRY